MRRAAALLTGLFVLGASTEAWAQSITVSNVERSLADHTQAFRFWVSREDCESADTFRFPYTITDPASVNSFEVWLGEGSIDCKTYEARTPNGASGQCTQLVTDGSPKQNGTIEITSAEIAGALESVEGCLDGSGNNNPRDVTLYFLLVRTVGEAIPAGDASQWTETKVDMLGPPPPTDVVGKVGSGTAIAEFEPRIDDDVRGYKLFCDVSGGGAGGAGVGGGDAGGEGCSGALVAGEIPDTSLECGSVTGQASTISANEDLENGVSVQIGVAAFDDLGNVGELSDVACVTPAPVDDFFTLYRAAGGQAGGGICSVSVGDDAGQGTLGLAALGLLLGLSRARRSSRSPRPGGKRSRLGRFVGLGLLGLALTAAVPSTALAQAGVPESNWRRTDRPPPPHPPAQFAFELRFGPYWPQIDDEFGTSPGPYETTFDADPQFYFGLEADWMPLRIPYVGMLGAGFGWGFTSASKTARISGCTTPEDLGADEDDPCESGDETSLTIMPMHLSAVLRADGIMRETEIPVVPYAKFGLGLATWSSSQTSGTSEVDGVEGSDTTWGLHMALGAMLSLNWMEPRSAARLYDSTGVAHAYVFGEWMNAMLNGIGSRPQMQVGTSTFVFGLAADF